MDKSSKNKQIEKIIKHFIGNTSKADWSGNGAGTETITGFSWRNHSLKKWTEKKLKPKTVL